MAKLFTTKSEIMKKALINGVFWVFAVLPVFAVQQTQADFSRYDIILDRRPFGTSEASEVAVAPVAPPKAVAPAESFIKDLRMCAIRDSVAGVSVGLVNMASKPATSFFLYEGEEEDGIILVEADFAEEKALLRKGGEEQWIYMNGAIRAASTPMGAQSNLSGSLFGVQRLISNRLKQPRGPRQPYIGTTRKEYLEKRASGGIADPIPLRNHLRGKSRRDDMTREESEVEIRKYNMELIRAKGAKGVPLPIPLTAEEDAILVQEGVLPPR